MNTRQFLFIFGRSPRGGVIDREMLDQMLTLAAFDQAITVLFVDEGVYRLTRDMDATASILKPSELLDLLTFYDIDSVWVEEESLMQRDMSLDDACLSVRIMPRAAVAGLLARHDVILGD